MLLPNSLHLPSRKPGSYLRRQFRGDVLYPYHLYGGIAMRLARTPTAATQVADPTAELLCQMGLVTKQAKQAYLSAAAEAFPHVSSCDALYLEQTHARLEQLRCTHLGTQGLELLRQKAMEESTCPTAYDIDQRPIRDGLLEKHSKFLLCLTDPALFACMVQDLNAILAMGKEAFVLTAEEKGRMLPTREALEGKLPAGTRFGKEGQCVLFYGEEGFLSCRSLNVPAFVVGKPANFYAKCVTSFPDGYCAVYIPRGLDITDTVPIVDRTQLSYRQYYLLWQACGEEIYELSPEELYIRYPNFFLNIYGKAPMEGIPLPPGTGLADFPRWREAALESYLGSLPGLTYYARYFDEDLSCTAMDFSGEKQPGILVHGIRVDASAGAKVMACGGKSPRRLLDGTPGTALVSNFLFFMTDKLGQLYNDLRADRPREQTRTAGEHLDFQLNRDTGLCSFPLFAKACVGMTASGQFRFFRFRLGGGSVCLGSHRLRWEKENVDAEGPVRVYTPFLSRCDNDADRNTYRMAVGHGRVNFIIVQDRVVCVRRGDVLLPSVGVVVSVEEALAAPILSELTPWEDGYYAPDIPLKTILDAPEGMSQAQWEDIRWAYGGGLSLIAHGKAFCDGDAEAWFEADGWTNPLSRQTQESVLHKPAKHPRTAIGVTESGALVVLVFSGRTWRSTGADYTQMVTIARSLFPDIRDLMNVDGGGSAMLGAVLNGSFCELSFPSTSTGSCVGMTRPINTVLYIPIES